MYLCMVNSMEEAGTATPTIAWVEGIPEKENEFYSCFLENNSYGQGCGAGRFDSSTGKSESRSRLFLLDGEEQEPEPKSVLCFWSSGAGEPKPKSY